MTKAITKAAFVAMSSADTNKLIVSVQKRAATLQADIHSAAMNCAAHATMHGDITLANRLLNALPKSQRRQAVLQWFLRFGQFAMNDDKSTKKDSPLVHQKDAQPFDADLAGETPFYELKAAEGSDTWNADAFILSLGTRLDTAIAKGGTPEQLAKLQAAKAALV